MGTGARFFTVPDQYLGSSKIRLCQQECRGYGGLAAASVVELKSVQDPSLSVPFVPASVFIGVQPAEYWSATTIAEDPTFAWGVVFGLGDALGDFKANSSHVWCVRGGLNADQY